MTGAPVAVDVQPAGPGAADVPADGLGAADGGLPVRPAGASYGEPSTRRGRPCASMVGLQ